MAIVDVICLDAVVVILRKDRMGVSRYWYRLAFLHKNYKEEMNGFILEGRRRSWAGSGKNI
jgi:hypothetical protein